MDDGRKKQVETEEREREKKKNNKINELSVQTLV
jgi:hypothetical protein